MAHQDFAFEHQECHAERVLVFPRFVRAGARAEVMYNPEIHGRGQARRVTVMPASPPAHATSSPVA